MKNNQKNILQATIRAVMLVKGFVLVLFLLITVGLPAQTENNPRVTQVKAAYLLNLTKFVYWKSARDSSQQPSLTIGLIQSEGIAGVLDDFIKKSSPGSGISVKRLNSWDSDLTGCQLIYIDQSQKNHLQQILNRLKGLKVLTVSDIEGFIRAGGMVGLLLEEGKIKIEINLPEVTDSGLEVSAKLLEVARVIKQEDSYD